MFDSFRNVGLLLVAGMLLSGALLATIVIGAVTAGSSREPTSATAIASATRSLPRSWVIRGGDTFTSIAARNDLSVAQLQQLNPRQDPGLLLAGHHLRLHLQTRVLPVRQRAVARVWIVRPGDTFTSIATQTGLHASDIARLNPNGDAAKLVPGEHLKLRP